MGCPWQSHALSPELDNGESSIEVLHSSGGGGGNREPAKLAMRIADEHSSSAREPAIQTRNPAIFQGLGQSERDCRVMASCVN